MACFAIGLTGCGTDVKPDYAATFSPRPGTKVLLATVVDQAPAEKRQDVKDFDIRAEMQSQLQSELRAAGLLAGTEPTAPQVELSTTIVNYEPGNAFARWLMPGMGATKLSLECRLLEQGNQVGTIRINRHVSAGGGYTIGQWKIIFRDAAKDVASELRKKFKA
jgi:hypothetical protein